MLEQSKREFIEFMLGADVLRFGEFKTKSGRLTPYFVNTGNYRTGLQLSRLGDFYAECVNHALGNNIDALFGPAYKGIPLVAACACSLARVYGLDKPFCFNRKEAKDHGEGGNLVGWQPVDGARVAIIEDVITAGTALRETLPILLDAAKVQVEHMFISVNRCEVGIAGGRTAVQEVKETMGIDVHAIVTVADIHEYLKQEAAYRAYLPAMEQYMEQYCIL